MAIHGPGIKLSSFFSYRLKRLHGTIATQFSVSTPRVGKLHIIKIIKKLVISNYNKSTGKTYKQVIVEKLEVNLTDYIFFFLALFNN